MAHKTPLIAALTVDLSQRGNADGEAPRVIKLLPAGTFRARDGRPAECAAWKLDEVLAAILIAEASGGTGGGIVADTKPIPAKPEDVALVTALVQVSAATTLAETAGQILAAEAEQPTLGEPHW